MPELTLKNNVEASRYEGWAGETLAGYAEYRLSDGLIAFPHTLVQPEFEGQGVGSQIVRFALDDVRADGSREVVPSCPFVKGWINRHGEYRDLVHRPSAQA